DEEDFDNTGMQSADTVVLLAKDTDAKTLTLRLVTGGKEQELSYDGTTVILNRHGDSLSMAQLERGEILDIVYSTHSARLSSIRQSVNTWTNTGVTKFSIDEKKKIMQIGDSQYQFTDDLVITSNGEPAQLMDLTQMDTLTVEGYNRKVCSIIVEKGHGYIRLLNDVYFVGGWIEVGQSVIKPITAEMLLPVPEGVYTVRFTNGGYAGEEKVKIERDKEKEIDLSKIEIEEVAVGHIAFQISPEYAQLYVDGEMTDYEERVSMEYGTHQLRVVAAGYETVETTIKVGSEFANIDIDLDKEEDTEEEDSDSDTGSKESSGSTAAGTSSSSTAAVSTTVSSSTAAATVSGDEKIYVEGPSGAEVYLDGNYVGIAPVSTSKVTGSHVITLSKSGYQTKSY
ncbi:MAG TPA: PEGA domain-containing protein, partial [Lachnospiraceae bacterium]|nr:PEGA domain-containing protein [Lachnospiraceae bacterium]